jgi:hypothetical protein
VAEELVSATGLEPAFVGDATAMAAVDGFAAAAVRAGQPAQIHCGDIYYIFAFCAIAIPL